MNIIPLRNLIIPIISLTIVFLTFGAEAQQSKRRVEEAKRLSLLDKDGIRQFLLSRDLYADWGGWINYRFTDYHDNDNDAQTQDILRKSSDLDARIWLKMSWRPEDKPEQNIYIRLKDFHTHNVGGPNIDNHDHEGPKADYAYGTFRYESFKAEIGRRYFNIGQGIAYSNVHDGVQLNYHTPGWNFGLLAASTQPHEDNIDFSVPGYDKKSDRSFYGLGVGYGGWRGHTLYGYSLVQRDESDARPASTQNYDYDSEYFGLGAIGAVSGRVNFNYWAEVIKQTGTSHVFTSNAESDIDAYAFNVGISKQWEGRFAPRLTLQYAFGSGDDDRADVTDTEDGNSAGDDTNFLYFGYIPTGFALAPRLSNLHLWRLGIEFQPFAKHRTLQYLNVGFDYFIFQKDEPTGGISDLDASASNKDIGQEIDFYLNWQVLSDVNLSFEYGYFMPGSAYPGATDAPENYLSASVTYSF